MSFQDYRGSPFGEWLLPIIPVGAQLSEGSLIPPDKIGKIPGLKYGPVWSGFPRWTYARIQEKTLPAWDGWYYPQPPTIGLQAGHFPGIDLDVSEAWQGKIARDVAFKVFGKTIIRGRANSPRQLLMYRFDPASGPPITKLRRVYENLDVGVVQFAVEILGKGQQYLIEGMHRTGTPYVWSGGVDPLHHGFENLPRITLDQVIEYVQELDIAFKVLSIDPVRPRQLRGDGGRGEDPKEINPQHPEVAPDLAALTEVLGFISVLDPELEGYDDWERCARAIKTACAGDEGFYDLTYLPWQLENPNNDDDTIRQKWESHTDSSIGFGYLEGLAQRRGYIPSGAGLFEPIEDDDDTAATSGPGEASARHHGPVPKPIPEGFALHMIPRRPFVLGHRFMAGAVTLGVGAPGAGKSNLAILTALSIATGRPLTGEEVHKIGPVWIHNNEDSLDELHRRIGGMLKCLGIDFKEVRPNILMSTGLDQRLIVAIKQKDIVKRTTQVDDVIASIKEQGIVHMVIDPLVSTHRGVSENSNEEVEQVMETIRHIAHETGCSIDLIHHSLKSHSGNTEVHAGDMNAARGAGSQLGAARIVYSVAQMSETTAGKMGINVAKSARLIRLDHSKGNYAARDTNIRWFELETFEIGNGDPFGTDGPPVPSDTIAVPKPWKPPADDVRASEAFKREVKLQQVRAVVAGAMSSDRCQVSELLPVIEQAFGLKRSAARALLKDAIPEGEGETAEVAPHTYLLKIDKVEPSPPGPVFVVRQHLFEQKAEAA